MTLIQVANQPHTFRCGHSGTLPAFGQSNEFAKARSTKTTPPEAYEAGWKCRICWNAKKSQQLQERGAWWAKMILRDQGRAAKKRNWTPPNISPEELIKLQRRSRWCSVCGDELDWTIKKGHLEQPHLRHDHKSGEVYGFAHCKCNWLEAMLGALSPKAAEQAIFNLSQHFPHLKIDNRRSR